MKPCFVELFQLVMAGFQLRAGKERQALRLETPAQWGE
jgi:hypothetical protein